MVVHTDVQVIAARGAVHSRQLQLGCAAYETHLVQDQRAFVEVDTSLQILGDLVEHDHFLHMRIQRQVHIGRNKERLRLGFGLRTLRFSLLGLGSRLFFAAAVGAEPCHQLICIAVIGDNLQFAFQHRFVFEPFADMTNVTFEVDV